MSRAVTLFTNLRIGPKIAIVMAALLVPLAMMTYLFVVQVNKDISFARSELSGLGYLDKVWSVMLAVGRNDAAGVSEGMVAVRAKGSELDATFKSGPAVQDLATATSSGRSRADIVSSGTKAIQAIADGSNLTLDPDLDSFYVIDALSVRAPDLLAAIIEVQTAARAFALAPRRPPDRNTSPLPAPPLGRNAGPAR